MGGLKARVQIHVRRRAELLDLHARLDVGQLPQHHSQQLLGELPKHCDVELWLYELDRLSEADLGHFFSATHPVVTFASIPGR